MILPEISTKIGFIEILTKIEIFLKIWLEEKFF